MEQWHFDSIWIEYMRGLRTRYTHHMALLYMKIWIDNRILISFLSKISNQRKSDHFRTFGTRQNLFLFFSSYVLCVTLLEPGSIFSTIKQSWVSSIPRLHFFSRYKEYSLRFGIVKTRLGIRSGSQWDQKDELKNVDLETYLLSFLMQKMYLIRITSAS